MTQLEQQIEQIKEVVRANVPLRQLDVDYVYNKLDVILYIHKCNSKNIDLKTGDLFNDTNNSK